MADRLVTDGYSKLGYKYVIIDDGWSAMERTANNELVADPKRFPGGMKVLIDYVRDTLIVYLLEFSIRVRIIYKVSYLEKRIIGIKPKEIKIKLDNTFQ